jgi:hypothetical protein
MESMQRGLLLEEHIITYVFCVVSELVYLSRYCVVCQRCFFPEARLQVKTNIKGWIAYIVALAIAEAAFLMEAGEAKGIVLLRPSQARLANAYAMRRDYCVTLTHVRHS